MGVQKAANMAAKGATKSEIRQANPGLSSKQVNQAVKSSSTATTNPNTTTRPSPSSATFGQSKSTQQVVNKLDNRLINNDGVFAINSKTFQNIVNDLGSAERARSVISKYGAGLPGPTTTETGEGDNKRTITNTPYKLTIDQKVLDKYDKGGYKADLSKQKGLSRQLRILGNDGVFSAKEYDKLLKARGAVGSGFNQRLINKLGEEGISISNNLAKRYEQGKISTGETNGMWDWFNRMTYTNPDFADWKPLTQSGNSEFTNRFLDEAYNGKGSKGLAFNGADWQTKDSVRAGAIAAGDWSRTREPWTDANITKRIINDGGGGDDGGGGGGGGGGGDGTTLPGGQQPGGQQPGDQQPTNPDSMNQSGLSDVVANWANSWRGAKNILRAKSSKDSRVANAKNYNTYTGVNTY